MKKPTLWDLFKTIGSFVITLVGFVSALVVMPPRFSVYPLDTLNPYSPFQTPFQISNDGMFSLNDVDTKLELVSLIADSSENIVANVEVSDTISAIVSIPPGDKATFFLPEQFVTATVPTYGEMYILVEYRPDYWPVKRKRWFYFKMKKDLAGQLHWLQYSLLAVDQDNGPEFETKFVFKGHRP